MGITAETTRSLTRPSKLRQPCSVDWTPNLQGVKFNGTDEYGNIGGMAVLGNDHTLSAWFKTTGGAGGMGSEGTIISYITSGGGGDDSILSVAGGTLAWSDFVDDDQFGTSTVNDGNWHHGVVVVTAANQKIYVDGALETTTTNSYSAGAAFSACAIGRRADAAQRFFVGDIDEVAIFPRALLASDITAIYNNGRPRDLTKYNPSSWWRLGDTVDGSGATVPDLGYGKNDATLVNIPLYKKATASTYSDYSIAFNGSDEYMDTGADTNLEDKTYSFWAKSSDTSATARNTVFAHGANNKGAFHLNWSSSRPLLYMGTGNYRFWNDTSSQDDGAWHHYAVCVKAAYPSGALLYIDGVLQTVNLDAGGAPGGAYSALEIGRSNSGEFFNGSLDEFAVFDGHLSSATINEIYAEGIPGKLTGHSPEHWWRMGEDDGGTGTLVTDAATPGVGAELIANGTMEADSNWNSVGVYVTQTRSDEFAHSGTYSRKVVSGAGAVGVKSDTLSVTAGKTYEVSFWYYRAASGGSVLTRLQDGNSNNVDASHELSATTGSWQNLKFHTTAATTGSSSYWWIYQNGVTGSTFYIDDVTVKEVNGAPGVLVNAPTSSRSTPAEDASYNHRSISFNGSDESMVTSADDTLASRSYSFWAKSDDSGVNRVFDHGDDHLGGFIFGPPLLYLNDSTGDGYYYRYWVNPSEEDDGAWHHYVVYLEHDDITNCKFYVDGVVQSAASTLTTGSAAAYTTALRIGVSGANYFDGSLSDFAVFEGELSAATVTAIYNNGVPADLSKHSPRNWWRMGEGDDTGSAAITDIAAQVEPTDLIANGGFASDSIWNKGTGWEIDDGVASNDGSGSYTDLSQDAGLDTNNTTIYEVTFTVSNYSSGSARALVGGVSLGTWRSANGTYTESITAGVNPNFAIQSYGFVGSVDNVSVTQIGKGNHGSLVNAPTFSTDSP